MAKLLDNYIFDDRMRYESHHLVYCYAAEEEPVLIGGFLGAAILCVRLINSEEGERRGIPLDIESEQTQGSLFTSYEQEVIADDWGHMYAEIHQLNDAYIQLTVSELGLSDLCPNMRQLSIAMNMTTRYMQRLVVEVFHEHIWEYEWWTIPFARWLFNAGHAETFRQRILTTDWMDPAMVNAFAEPHNLTNEPTFIFEGEDAEDIMRRYWEWLWESVRKRAAESPDAEQQLAQTREQILAGETSDRCVEDDLRELPTDTQKLFRKWMTRWTAFVTDKLAATALDSFPEQQRQTRVEQVLFPDATLTCPEPNRYTQVRDYIHDRSRYDEVFLDYYNSHTLNDFCEQLSRMFGWYVNPNSLGKSLKRKKK